MRSPFSSVLFVTVILVSSTVASTTLSVNNSGFVTGPLSGKWFDYVVVIMMENHNINNTYYKGVGTNPCFGDCTYYTSLANSGGLAEEYTIEGINAAGCSIGCYIAITSGYGATTSTCNSNPPGSSGCPFLQIPNIVDRIESAGLSWKAYMEGYPKPSTCFNDDGSGTSYYHFDHNPFIYYADIHNSPARCARIVSANSQTVSQATNGCWPSSLPTDDLFLNDLNSTSTASNYMFLSPNTIDDNHDCDDVSIGNAWLNQVIPQVLGSPLFKNQRAALLVTFDEPGCTFSTCPSSPHGELYTVWASNAAHPITNVGFKSMNAYTHYSALRTVEDNWKLSPLISTTDGSAQNMTEFFR